MDIPCHAISCLLLIKSIPFAIRKLSPKIALYFCLFFGLIDNSVDSILRFVENCGSVIFFANVFLLVLKSPAFVSQIPSSSSVFNLCFFTSSPLIRPCVLPVSSSPKYSISLPCSSGKVNFTDVLFLVFLSS